MKHLNSTYSLDWTLTAQSSCTTPALPYFLLSQNVFILSSNDKKYFNNTVYVDRSLWAKFFALNRITTPNKLPVVVDGIQYSSTESTWVVQFNLASLTSDNRLSVYTLLPTTNLALITVSTVYRSVIWLERELSDFTGINFLGLLDTRRLLLDYFEVKTSWQTHVNNDKNFNENLYDIMLSY